MEQEEDISFESEAPVRQQHQQQNSTTKRIKQKLPLRLCFFDAETSQDQPMSIGANNNMGFKHIPLLLIAEVICEKCIVAGISIGDVGQRAPGCFCGKPRGQRWQRWCSPPFKNAPDDNTPMPDNLGYNPRRMYFHSFDNEEENPVDQFLDYLLTYGSQRMLTVCIAHNGGKYDFHLILEALHRRSLPPKNLCTTGLKIYSMRLGGNHQRKILFKDSLNYFICELDALTKIQIQQQQEMTNDPFVIESVQQLNSRSRNTRGEICNVRFNPLEEQPRPDLTMTTLISRLLDRVLAGRPPPLRVGLQLHPPAFHNPFTVPLRPPAQNNPAALAAAIERLNEVSQAGIDLLSGTTTTKVLAIWPLEAQRTDNPADHGGISVIQGACDIDLEHVTTPQCQSLIRIRNPEDRYCLARAVHIGLKKIRLMEANCPRSTQQFRTFCQQQHEHLEPVIELMQNAGLPLDLQNYSLNHVSAIQIHINQTMGGEGHIRIVVFQKEQQYRIVFKGDGRAALFNICLLLENGHYNYIVIESVQQLNSRSRNTRGEICNVRFNPLEEQPRPDLTMTTLISRLLDRVLAGRPPPLRVGLQLHPPAFHNPFTVPLRPPAQNNPAALAAAIERLNEVSQAGIDLLSGTTTTKVLAIWPLEAQRTDNPADHGGISVIQGACDIDLEHVTTPQCQSLIRIRNPEDRYCLARAVHIGLKKIRLMEANCPRSTQQFRTFCQQQHEHLEPVIELMQNAGPST
uniref:DNA-directed DNA polymerase n=1 Tax=Meloidogyne hapla TaxID=6305 RepID=A0A1I8BV39_MELHA